VEYIRKPQDGENVRSRLFVRLLLFSGAILPGCAQMPATQTYRIVRVRPGHGNRVKPQAGADPEVVFPGDTMNVVEPAAIAGR
jgi:hypothetical protein